MPLDRLPSLLRQAAQIAGGLDGDGEAFRAQKVAHAFGAPDEHRGLGIGRDQDQNLVVLCGRRGSVRGGARLVVRHPMLDFMRGLPKRKLPQRDQSLFAKEVLQSALGLLALVHHASLEPIQQGARREVHHHHFIRLLHHPVRDRLADPNAADLPDLIVQAFQMLDVHGGQNVDTGGQQHLHVLPALGALGAGNIGVRKLIHDADLRMPRQDGLRIHLLKERAAILDLLPGNDLQAFGFRDRLLAAVRLEIADHDVDAGSLQLLSLFQHLVGLADAGGIAHEDLQFPALLFRHLLLGEHAHVHAVAFPDQLVERAAPESRESGALAVSDEELRDAAGSGELEKGLRRDRRLPEFRCARRRRWRSPASRPARTDPPARCSGCLT